MCIVCLGLQLYVLITSLTKDIKNDLNAFSQRVRSESNPVMLTKQLFHVVRFHSRVKRFDKNQIFYETNQ